MVKEWKKLLNNSNFWYIWVSQILSQVTIFILNFVILFSLFEKTQSSIATSFLWIVFALPSLFIGPFASTSVDMLDLRRVLMFTNFFQAVLIGLYAFVVHSSPFIAYAVVLGYSILNQFYVPAEFAALPKVIDHKLLPQANGLFLITQQGSLILGFGVAGLILKTLGITNTLVICGFLLFFAYLSTYFLPQMKTNNKIPEKLDEIFLKFFENTVQGINFIKENKFVLAPFLLLISMQVTLAIVTVNAPIIAKTIMKVPLALAGTYLVVPGGIGALIGSFSIPKLLARGVRKIRIIKSSLIILTVSLFAFSFIFSQIGSLFRTLFSLVALASMGFSYVGIIIPSQTFLQANTPHGFRGRVFGNYWFLVTVITVFPVILSGTITEIFGARTLMFFLTLLIIGLYIFLKDREKKYLLPKNHT